MDLKILIVGVGGQGTLLASRVLGNFAMKNNLDCKLSEVHGMAQRGGSVVTHVTIKDKVYSPIIKEGDADIIIAFEQLESLRYAHFIKSGGSIVVSQQKIMPMPIVTGKAKYPDDIELALKKYTDDVVFVDALKMAKQAGSEKALNIVMLGIMAKKLKLNKELFKQSIIESVPSKTVDINISALELGYKI